MAWIYLLIAGIFEVFWAVGLKYTESWTRLWPSVFTILSMLVGLYFLSLALRDLPIGTAYAIWTGIGTLGTVAFGIFFLDESTNILRMVSIFLIIAGITGLKILS